VLPRRVRSDERSRFDQSIFPQSRSPFPLLSFTASAYGDTFRKLAFAAALVLALSACSPSETRATPAPTPCAEPTRGTGDAAFDDQNRTRWRKEVDAGGPAACDNATKAYIARLDEHRGAMMLASASTFAMYGRVTDSATGAPVDQVCVTPGKPGTICWARTDADGWYVLDLGAVSAQQGFFEIFFTKTGYPEQHSVSRMLSGRAQIDYQMAK
jgi:hypothetical protein